MNTALVIMAAGLGSRYGGVKQIDRVGPAGEILMEYAIYDALRAGFDKLVVIIKREMLDDCRSVFGDRVEHGTGLPIHYAFQDSHGVWDGAAIPDGRSKPLGTVHAVLSAADQLDRPFAVINADDYYGPQAFRALEPLLSGLTGAGTSAMVSYQLKNTVSPNGSVTRGICTLADGLLRNVRETYQITLAPDGSIRTGDTVLHPDSPVSMNLWGLHPDILPRMVRYLGDFLRTLPEGDNSAECLLPTAMDALIAEGTTRTQVLETRDRWFGLTYREDKPAVAAGLRALHAAGVYPPGLWNEAATPRAALD